MTFASQFKLPDLGEGLTEGEILQWLVAVGDTVTLNQPIVEVETAKAAVELPSPYAGHGHRDALRRRHDGRRRHADHHDRHRWRRCRARAGRADGAAAPRDRRAGGRA